MKNLIIKNLQDMKNAYRHYDATILKMSANQDIPAGAYTKANFDTVIKDQNGNFDGTNTRVNIKKDSFYLVTGAVFISVTSGKYYTLSIYKSGIQVFDNKFYAAATGDLSIPMANVYYVNKGDYIETKIYCEDAQTVYASGNTRFSMIQIPLKF